MSTIIRERLRTATLPDGQRALILDCEIPDDVPSEIKEGLARRALSNSGHPCPCGATWPRPNRAQRRKRQEPSALLHIVIEHADDCPAETERLVTLIRAWEAGR